MQAPENPLLVQQAIQLSVAPVFLLTDIAGLLGVMASPLARIIDRAREVGRGKGTVDAAAVAVARLELAGLELRRHLASWSINCCTGAALLVCGDRGAVHRGVPGRQPEVAGRRAVHRRHAVCDCRPVVLPGRGLHRNAHLAH